MDRIQISKAENLPNIKDLFEKLPKDLGVDGGDVNNWWINQKRSGTTREDWFINQLADYATHVNDDTTEKLCWIHLNLGWGGLVVENTPREADDQEKMRIRGIFQQWLIDVKIKLKSLNLLLTTGLKDE